MRKCATFYYLVKKKTEIFDCLYTYFFVFWSLVFDIVRNVRKTSIFFLFVNGENVRC